MGVNGCVIRYEGAFAHFRSIFPGLGEGAFAYRLAALALLSLSHGRFWGVSILA